MQNNEFFRIYALDMKISDFYSHPTMIEAWGKARIRRVISEIREVWPDFLVKQTGQFPSFYRAVNQYYAAWILFILSNCKSHSREDVVKAIFRGQQLKRRTEDGRDELFVVWLGDLLADPNAIKQDISSIAIFFDQDNMASVFTEPKGAHKGVNLLFHGKSPAYKIRRSSVLEKDFLFDIAELIHEEVLREDQQTWGSTDDGFYLPD